MIDNGMKVKDRVTGFSGMVVAVSRHLTGCDRAFVEPPVKEDGSKPEGYWFDIDTLKRTDKKQLVIEQGEKPGGKDLPAPR